MSLFSKFTPIRAGLLLVGLMTLVPTGLHAEPKPQTPTTTATPAQPTPNPNPVKPSVVAPKSQPGNPHQPELKPQSGTTMTSTGVNPAANNTKIPVSKQPTVKQSISASNNPVPAIDAVNLILKLNEKHVYVYKGDKVIAKYPVAIGKKGWETPTGEWQVMETIKNPAWTSFKTGAVIKAGRESPLGERWIGFWTDGKDMIGFHGTPDVKSIGTAASHGCVRMFNKDVKALFKLVKVGTTVKVVNE